MMFLLVLLLSITIVLGIEYSFVEPLTQPPAVEETYKGPVRRTAQQAPRLSPGEIVPIAFPAAGKISMPNIIQPQNGPLQVQGAVQLGVQGNQYMDFSTGDGKATLKFMNGGQQGLIQSSGGSGGNNGDMLIQSKSVAFEAPVSVTGKLSASKGTFTSLKVNRSDTDRYPNWSPGIHTWDLYANGAVAAGQNGNVAVGLYSNGDIRCNGTANMNTVSSNNVWVGGRNILNELNGLRYDLDNAKRRV